MGLRLLRLLLPVLVVVAAVLGARWMLDNRPEAKPRSRTPTAPLVEVVEIPFGPLTLTAQAMGTVLPALALDLTAQVSGRVVELGAGFEPGGMVKKGEVLLRIDPRDYELAVRQAEAEVARAESELQLEAGRRLVARQEFELAGAGANEEEKRLMLRAPQQAGLQASLEAARARLDRARLDLSRTTLTAPFNAVVMERRVAPGAMVTAAGVLARLAGTDAFWVEAVLPVADLARLRRPGAGLEKSAVRVSDNAAWGEGFFRRGQVERLLPGLEEQGRMARLLVRVENPLDLAGSGRLLLLGSYVQVEIEGNALERAAAVPRQFFRDRDTLWVLDKEGKLAIRQPEISHRGREEMIICSGIEPGERLVTTDLVGPVDGMLVRLAESEQDGAKPAPAGGNGE